MPTLQKITMYYDAAGLSVRTVTEQKDNSSSKDFDYLSGVNILKQIDTGGGTKIQDFSGACPEHCFGNATGNQLTAGTNRHYEWTAANRLRTFRNQAGTSEPSVYTQYLYDNGGNRVKKITRKQGGSYEIRTYIDGVFEYYTDETNTQNTIHIMDSLSRENGNKSRIATVRIGYAFGDTTPPRYRTSRSKKCSCPKLVHD